MVRVLINAFLLFYLFVFLLPKAPQFIVVYIFFYLWVLLVVACGTPPQHGPTSGSEPAKPWATEVEHRNSTTLPQGQPQ